MQLEDPLERLYNDSILYLQAHDTTAHGSQGSFYCSRLRRESRRLLSSNGDVNIDILMSLRNNSTNGSLQSDSVCRLIENQNENDMTNMLLEERKAKSRFFIIVLKPLMPKLHSISKLHISEKMLRIVFSQYRIFPPFLDHIHSYGIKVDTDAKHDTLHGVCRHRFHHISQETEVQLSEIEVCYSLSYSIKRPQGKPGSRPRERQSLRLMSVYHKYNLTDDTDTWLLVKPMEGAVERIKAIYDSQIIDALAEQETPAGSGPSYGAHGRSQTLQHINPLSKHLVFLTSANMGWRDYYNIQEDWFLHNYTIGVILTDPANPRTGTSGKPNDLLKTIHDVQQFYEDVQYFRSCVSNNEATMRRLKSINANMHELRSSSERKSFLASHIDFDSALDALIIENEQYQRNAKELLRTAERRSTLLRQALEFRTNQRIADNGNRELEQQLAKAAQKDSGFLMKLSKRTAMDAIQMKIIAVIASLYLPCTLVATVLGSAIFDFDREKSGFFKGATSLNTDGLFIFSVATLVLTVGTYFMLRYWNERELRKVNERLKEDDGRRMTLVGA
ncbi:hypothetical protein BJ508DRAFT_413023 [Ascobolus immersus RN42]|uniref:CorA-like transporter domain-containing protein n=1 Tax=Ascobolus immersus RN42 TaxID=1160509 RepID=A0A3N4IIL1_ASCIM|nr:hypothetical protein BJ508DRAFT_413023 [Ascobolus immersus RN42]